MTDERIDPEQEDVEGLGSDEDSGWGDYPIDTVLIRHETRTVHDVLRRIEKGSFVMNPDFQRAFIWSDDKQSKLIESVLMRIPLPVFYLAEDAAGRMVVVDGLQRLSSFSAFVGNELRLKLPDQDALNGKLFKELSPKLQNRVEDSNLVLYVIDAKVPERARLDIFERVNSGVPLTRQQMRNSLYTGPATRFLRDEAEKELFLDATGRSLKSSTMRDREFVNRFCAFKLLPYSAYRGDMDEFLAMALMKMNLLGSKPLIDLSKEFELSLANNLKIFGKHAFRKHALGQEKRSPLNASLWDVMTTFLAGLSTQEVEARRDQLRSAFYTLLRDYEFERAITYGVNDARNVNLRFQKSRAILGKAIDDIET